MEPARVRPLFWLQEFGRRYPHAWKTLEAYRALRGSAPELHWPAWVYVPLAGAYSVVSEGKLLTPGDPRLPDVARLAALGAWRMTKGIYRFDPDLFAELWEAPYEGPITLEPLRHLPEWAVYVETPNAEKTPYRPHGFFALLEHDLNSGHDELYLVWDIDDPEGNPRLEHVVLHLNEPTLADALRASTAEGLELLKRSEPAARAALEAQLEVPLEEALARSIDFHQDLAGRAVSLLYYLILSRDLAPTAAGQPPRPHRPTPKRTRRGPRLFAANTPQTWEVGVRYGRALRAYRTAAGRSTSTSGAGRKRPHVRRAHWHGYWTGPRDDPQKRRLELRWLTPILVGAKENDLEELPAVIWPVKEPEQKKR